MRSAPKNLRFVRDFLINTSNFVGKVRRKMLSGPDRIPAGAKVKFSIQRAAIAWIVGMGFEVAENRLTFAQNIARALFFALNLVS